MSRYSGNSSVETDHLSDGSGLHRLMQDQLHVLRNPSALWYAAGERLFREPRLGRALDVTWLKSSRDAIVVAYARDDGPPAKQLFVRTRRHTGLFSASRKQIAYNRYQNDFRRFLWMQYGVSPNQLPPEFFTLHYNVDHAIPLSWLLKAAEHGGDVAEVEYVGIVLCPAAANKAWGAFFEKRMVQADPRSNDLGAANFFTLCKICGIMPYRVSNSTESFAAFGTRVLDGLVEHGFFTADEREIFETSTFMSRNHAPLSAVLDPTQSGSLVAVHPILELWLSLTGTRASAGTLPPEPPSIPDHRSHEEMRRALDEVDRWLGVEGVPPKPAAVMRELVKISRDSGRIDVKVAAFAMLAAGFEPNADDVAWLVRDLRLGYPDQPSFEF